MTAAPLTKRQRAARMRRLRGYGWTLQRIGDKYGVTRQRVEQILKDGKP